MLFGAQFIIAWSFYIYPFPVTLSNIGQGILYDLFSGAYYQFWFIYLIVGLYLITPILRVIIANGDSKIIRYLILLWFVGVAVVPLVQLASGYTLNSSVFVIGGWVGYFVLGYIPAEDKVAVSHLVRFINHRFRLDNIWHVAYELSIKRHAAKLLLF